jgi:hypothetical protein
VTSRTPGTPRISCSSFAGRLLKSDTALDVMSRECSAYFTPDSSSVITVRSVARRKTASATPARIAGQWRRGIGRCLSITRMYDVSPAKKKPIREAYADRWVRERCQLRINKRDDRSSRSTHLLLLLL